MSQKLVTILVPNYKTLLITQICLRLIRHHTDPALADVIVIDNDSNDESTEYLRSLPWITLIERPAVPGETGVQAHSRALDLALKQVTTPYVLSIHTDTFIKRRDWLEFLLAQFDSPNVAGVGSWKLESKSRLRQLGIRFEQSWKYALHKWFGYEGYRPERLDSSLHYLRSHCAIYKTDIIQQLATGFADGDATAGKVMHQKMRDHGYEMKFLPSSELGQYIDHLNHATSILNPELRRNPKHNRRNHRRIKNKLRGIDAVSLLANPDLDK
ncbi:Glycosyltransferase [Methylophaga frappieri]|uniref:Glycosyltransferase n=1 Tax=Methylophaga frappieri (strain ATCC BAA-2434 / DSM 25690 / JAM7) TaxID=754477 RepID=I1YKE7_METFJ|nr:glycosyltransferase [Methylophaga frappieri]AFJ03390.1 Glycosyltransferase [Methylophaga frappieri]